MQKHSFCQSLKRSQANILPDILDSFETIKVAIAYKCKTEDGVKVWTDRLPADLRQLAPENCDVEYKELQGWKTDIANVRSWEDLPQNAKTYVEYIESELGVPIQWIGVGPARDAMIQRGSI